MSRRHCSGLALTEVLVAAVVLALGLLGQLALLVAGLRTERAAAELATAATLAADLGERIRSNPAAVESYVIDPEGTPPPAATCAVATPFDATARAACDLHEWQREAAAALPGMSASVAATELAGTAARLCIITLRWDTQDAQSGEFTLRLQV